jgi:uncharacterized protein (DUF952 family)
MTTIFKIMSEDEWNAAVQASVYAGSAVDKKDGYIHFSAQEQLRETAAKYFAGLQDLVLIAFDSADFGETLKWEVSRGGALFPHLYAPLPTELALWVKPLPWNGTAHDFPVGWNA